MAFQKLEDQLAELSAQNVPELRNALRSRSNLLAAKAARIAGRNRIVELEPELVAAFDRFLREKDPGCSAKTEAVKALVALEHSSSEIFLRGIRHVQMEGSYGPPIDTAATLRGTCAMGLAQTHYSGTLLEITSLLVDKEPAARVGAVRAIGMTGREEGAWLVRLRVLTGEGDPDVLAECFAVLLAVAARDSLPFVTECLNHQDDAIAETAALALGESHLPEAFAILKDRLASCVLHSMKRTLMNAIALLRREEAVAYLETLAKDGDQHARAALQLIAHRPSA